MLHQKMELILDSSEIELIIFSRFFVNISKNMKDREKIIFSLIVENLILRNLEKKFIKIGLVVQKLWLK